MKGIVLEDKKDMLKVEIVRQEACGQCKACLAGIMEKRVEIEAKNLCDAETGDWVELELQDNAFMKAVLISYGVPLIAFLAGIFLGFYGLASYIPFMNEGLVAIITGVIGLFLAYAWIRSKNPTWENGKYLPLAVRLTTEGEGDFEQLGIQ